MKLSTVTTIATVLLLWLLPVMGAHPRKLDPDELFVQDANGNWIVCPAPAPAPAPAPLVPFRFDSSLVNSPITQPAVIPTNVPIRIDHEIDIENDIQHAQQLSILDFYGTSSHNDRFPVASSSASSRSRRRVSDDGSNACNLPADTLPVASVSASSRPRRRRRVSDDGFDACNLPTDTLPVASSSASSRSRRRRRVSDDGFDASNLPTDTLPVASSRSRRHVSDEFEACSFDPLRQSIPSPVASASSPDDPEWFDDDHELDDDELKCVDGLKVDDSVADIDSSQPVPTTEVSINVAATVHSTLH